MHVYTYLKRERDKRYGPHTSILNHIMSYKVSPDWLFPVTLGSDYHTPSKYKKFGGPKSFVSLHRMYWLWIFLKNTPSDYITPQVNRIVRRARKTVLQLYHSRTTKNTVVVFNTTAVLQSYYSRTMLFYAIQYCSIQFYNILD